MMEKNDQLKIGIDAHSLGSQSGGNETYTRFLIQSIKQYDETNEYVIYFANEDEYSKFQTTNRIQKKLVSSSRTRILKYPWIAKKDHLDLLHMQYTGMPTFGKTKLCVTIHDIIGLKHKNFFSFFDNTWMRILIPLTAKWADGIIGITESAGQDIIKILKVTPDKVHTVHNGFDTEPNIEIQESTLGKFNVDKDNYAIFIGNLHPRKNLERIVKAYDLYRKESDRNLKLVVVGKKAWLTNSIFDSIRQSPFLDDIIMTDYISDVDKYSLVSYSKFLLFPSLDEGFGIPILEGFVNNTPVMTSNIGAMKEVADNAAYLVDPYNIDEITKGFKELDQDEVLRNKLISKGKERLQFFNLKDYALKMINTYKKICQQK